VAARRRRLLLTGYEPFGGEPVNPSGQIARDLAAQRPAPDDFEVRAVVLPVAREAYAAALGEALDAWRPDALIAIGQATGRARVDVELVAHNALDTKGEADNAGHVAAGEPLVPGGPERLLVPLDLEPVCKALAKANLPIGVSRDAGRHLCNALLYELLHHHATLPAFFVHVPLLPEQAERRARDEPCLPIEVSAACLVALIERLPGVLDGRA